MTTYILQKGDNGKLAGLGEKASRAWAKFRAHVAEMAHGETVELTVKLPRSPAHHRLFFARIQELHDRQEQFADADRLRQWLTVGAGYCDLVPGPKGRMVALPQSIKWSRMDEAEFSALHQAVEAFLWTDHARRFLWPHLSDEATYAAVAQVLGASA